MNLVNNYPVCEGCKWSSLHTCHKFNKECLSVKFGIKRYQLICTDCLKEDSWEEGQWEIPKYKGNIGWFHLPGTQYWSYWKSLLCLKQNYPEVFIENRDIREIYGNFPGSIWNGRTPDYGDIVLTIQDLDKIRKEIEETGIRLNLTFNNNMIEETDVYDRWSNSIASVFHNGKHAITVASPILFKYLKEKYPNYQYYRSVISSEHETEYCKDINFDYVLWPRKYNNNWEKLNEVPYEDREKLEFLCNDGCTPICDRNVHYNICNSCYLQRSDESVLLKDYCTIDHDFMGYNTKRWPISINPEHIDKYINNGFVHFKLCSRGDNPILLMYKTIQYLIKPQYIESSLDWIINKFYNNEERRKLSC